jgi:pimeloyl-ACP methyl ester carboxylesterase
VVLVPPGDRIHFVDWAGSGLPAVVLIHGLGGSTAVWSPVARRLAAYRRVVAMDLRGHGLSDAPTEVDAYGLEMLADDVIAVAEGSGVVDDTSGPGASVVLAGHGFGAIVAAVAAARLRSRCARLVLVDGGLVDMVARTGQDVEEFLRGLEEPPEVLRSMAAYLADRRGWDPASWDEDQERAARAAVVETPAGRLVQATRPHALEASVRAMFTYRPDEVLPEVVAPIVAVSRRTQGDDDSAPDPESGPARFVTTTIELEAPGHNLMRYRPAEVTATILDG